MEYSDLARDLKLQKQMYEDLKVMIQDIVGFEECFVDSVYNGKLKGYEQYHLFERMGHDNSDKYKV